MSLARPRLELLGPEQIEAVHDGSLRVLRELGLRVDSERARRIFAKAGPGARIDGDRVTFARELVEWAIQVSPPWVDVHDRRGRPAFRLGEGQEATRFGTGVTNLWYQEPGSDEIVPFQREHLVAGVRLSQKLGNYDVISTLGILRDLPPALADLFAVLEMVANAEKPLVLLVSDESLFPAVLDLLETLHGDLGTKPFVLPHVVDFYDPQSFLINVACAEMMAHYRIPHAGTSGSGEGWGPDLLATGTQWMNQLTSTLGRVGLAPFVGSSLNSKAFSPLLAVYGDEVIGQARLFARGFHVSEAEVGVDEAIAAMKSDGHFLMTPTTLERYQTACYPGMFPHISLEKWQEDRPVADRVLRERARDLLAEAEPPEDHDELLARGEAFITAWEARGR